MKKMISIALIMLIGIAILFSGCSNAKTARLKAADLMGSVQAASWSETPDRLDNEMATAISRFSAGLFKASTAKNGNVMVSPASVFLALAMTLNGADGETRSSMLNVLAGEGVTVDMINKASRDWITWLGKTGGKTTLSIANSIWFREGFKPYQPFLQSNADYFRAGAKKLDFADQTSADVINAWVNESTRGTIKKIIEKISPSTVMFLINSIYFKSDWQTPFEKNETRSMAFNTPKGPVDVDFMHRIDKMSYFSGNGATGVALPYDNGQFAYFALLPDGQTTPREWMAQQDQSNLFNSISALMAQKSNFTVDLAMPKFEVSYEDSLNDELTLLGMANAFDPGQADFSQMNEQRAKGLYISEVKHKTFIRVDEKGTEAAAVTSVAIDESAVQSDKLLKFDRPFLYGIIDLATGIPLFAGIMEDPAAS